MTNPETAAAWWWPGGRAPVLATSWTLVLGALVLFVALWVRHRRQQHTVFARLGIPFVPPHLIYGSNHVLRDPDCLCTDRISQWIKEYGTVFGYYVGWRPYMVVADPDLIKQVLIKDFHNYTNRPKLVINAKPVMKTVVGLRDQRWKDVRSVLAPTFSMVKMKHMAGIMNHKVDRLMALVEETSSRGEAPEWYTTFQGLTLDVISECALAMKTNCQQDQNKDDFLVAVKEFLQYAVNPAVLLALYFPFFANLLCFISNRLAVSGRMTHMIIEHLKVVIAIRRREHQTNKKYVDVLQLMLDAAESRQTTESIPTTAPLTSTNHENTKLTGDNNHAQISTTKDSNLNNSSSNNDAVSPVKERARHKLLSDDEIIANAWVFLLGGFETTANTLTYTCYLLATHPHVQDILYHELCQAVQDSGSEVLTYDQVRKLRYLDQVLSESLRYYSPVVTFITRETARPTQLGDKLLPQDMNILIPVWELHHDPAHWPNPEVFNPDRFAPDNPDADNRHPMAYLPFGAGPRNCPGMRFAQLEAKLTIARLIYKFRLEVCDQTPSRLTFKIYTVTINPKQGVYLRAIPRSPTPKAAAAPP